MLDTYFVYNPLKSVSEFPRVNEDDITRLLNPEIVITPEETVIEEEEKPIVQFKKTVKKSSLKGMSLEQLIKEQNLPIKITSSYRPHNTSKSGNKSHHTKLDEYGNPTAYDIQPLINGKVDKSNYAFNYLREVINSNPVARQWFKDHDYGILDETTPSMMAKTGATGKHFHIGPDRGAVRLS